MQSLLLPNNRMIHCGRSAVKHLLRHVRLIHARAKDRSLTSSLVLVDIDFMSRCGGTKVLFQALGEGPVELVPLIATAFLYIIDAPKTRSYLHPGTDFEVSQTQSNIGNLNFQFVALRLLYPVSQMLMGKVHLMQRTCAARQRSRARYFELGVA